MKRHWKLPLALLAGLLAIAFVALFFANRVQRADGAILLLAIDGRQVHSIGASFGDARDVMLDFGV